MFTRWAHRVVDRFPDGQLYVNLRGFGPTGSATTPAEALRGFLEAFQVPPQRLPDSVEARAALYRSLTANKRVLVLLDNARDSEQVRPLIPGSPGSLVLVTSRHELLSLVTVDAAHSLTLDLLTWHDARQLMEQRLGPQRVAAEPDAVNEIINRCARLPLALAIVTAHAATRPTFTLATSGVVLVLSCIDPGRRPGVSVVRCASRTRDLHGVGGESGRCARGARPADAG